MRSGKFLQNTKNKYLIRQKMSLIFLTNADVIQKNFTKYIRLEKWKNNLLDLTSKTGIINFKENNRTLKLNIPQEEDKAFIAKLEDFLAVKTSFNIIPKTEKEAISSDQMIKSFKKKELLSDLNPKELGTRLLNIYRQYRLSLDESGISTLFLTLGMLEWYESDDSNKIIKSPLVFIPLDILRKGSDGFFINKGDDETRINLSLLNRLKYDFGIEFPDILINLPTDQYGFDIPKILSTFEETIQKVNARWNISYPVYIGHFTYSKYLMWKDLDELDYDNFISTNKLFSSILDPEKYRFNEDISFPEGESLDREYPPDKFFCPLSYDSSQLQAVIAAGKGKSFVLYGPPGTGKSQTIANIIANSLATNKTVLFVSEKRVALDVVHKRLEESGLEPFCLELHSSKSKRGSISDQLKESLEYEDSYLPYQWQEKSGELHKIQTDLDEYIKNVHIQQKTGESFFQGINALIKLRNTPYIQIQWPSYSLFSKEDLELRRDCLKRLSLIIEDIGDPSSNPWNSVRCIEWSNQNKRILETDLKQLKTEVVILNKIKILIIKSLFRNFQKINKIRYGYFIALLNIISSSSFIIGPKLLLDSNFESTDKWIKKLIADVKEYNMLRSQVFTKYTQEILNLDHDEIIDYISKNESFFSIFKKKRIFQNIESVSKGQLGDRDELLADMQNVKQIRILQTRIDKKRITFYQLLGIRGEDKDFNWNQIDEILLTIKKIRKIINDSSLTPEDKKLIVECISDISNNINSINGENHHDKKRLEECIRTHKKVHILLKNIKNQLKIEDIEFNQNDPLNDYLNRIYKKANIWIQNLDSLKNWCLYQNVRENCIHLDLKPIIDSLENKNISADAVLDFFNRSYYDWWIDCVRNGNKYLKKYFRQDHEDTIDLLNQIDEDYRHLVSQQIIARLMTQKSVCNQLAPKEFDILKKQISLERKSYSIRALFGLIPTILPRLKPCFLMSPLSVAQYLKNDTKFDILIFDEASQIPVWDAMGSIARAKQVIVVGDPKQLPPFDTFKRSIDDDDENILYIDTESILNECISLIPDMSLKWHYRSRHESLIAFSNYHFYDNSLITFPSSHSGSAISMKRINGTYDAGKSRTNRKEAALIVQEIIRRSLDPGYVNDSLGVVTFNVPQQELIWELLESEKIKNSQLVPLINDEDKFFVKNLENIQGDERDVILFSICYGPDMYGKVSLNLGPLTQDGGERRLNVAITRAKKEIIVYSSLFPENINEGNVSGKGVKLLKSFLEYAENGMDAIRKDVNSGKICVYESPLEEEIGSAILDLGYEFHTQVGCGGYRIDIGILDPLHLGRYILGVECDGANYHCFKTARDRDRLREEVLKGLGWNIHRIWSTDWWDDPKHEINRLQKVLIGLQAGKR